MFKRNAQHSDQEYTLTIITKRQSISVHLPHLILPQSLRFFAVEVVKLDIIIFNGSMPYWKRQINSFFNDLETFIVDARHHLRFLGLKILAVEHIPRALGGVVAVVPLSEFIT